MIQIAFDYSFNKYYFHLRPSYLLLRNFNGYYLSIHLDLGQREKIDLNFYFHTSSWCLKKDFMKALKAFEPPQSTVKTKILS